MEKDLKFSSAVCTSRVQSERLLALGLKKETADCYLFEYDKEKYKVIAESWLDLIADEKYYSQYKDACFPAWSLHRLIEIMPTTIKSRYGYVNLAVNAELVQYQYYDEDYMHNECCQHFNDGALYDNIIDCISWLIKEGYFNKEYLEE